MTSPLAHIAGLPAEEALPTLAPAAWALALAVRLALARARGRRGRRHRRPARTDARAPPTSPA